MSSYVYYKLSSLPIKPRQRSEGSGKVTGLKFKSRTRTQSRTAVFSSKGIYSGLADTGGNIEHSDHSRV